MHIVDIYNYTYHQHAKYNMQSNVHVCINNNFSFEVWRGGGAGIVASLMAMQWQCNPILTTFSCCFLC